MSKKMQSKTNKEAVSIVPRQVDLTDSSTAESNQKDAAKSIKELGGPKGLEPTRYGDWESKGRCYDF